MEIGRSFSYQFDDAQWITKLGLGALISLVPILNLVLVGYMVATVRNVAAGMPEPLPNWDDLGEKFRDGLLLTLAGLIYAAPALLLICLPLGLLVLSGALSQNDKLGQLGQWAMGAGWVVFVGVVLLIFVYLLLISILQPIILVIFSRERTFASCFKLRQVLDILGRRTGAFAVAWILTVVGGLAVGLLVGFVNLLVGWIPCLGWIVGTVLALGSTIYLITADAHLLGRFRVAAFGQEASPASASSS